MQLAVRDLNFSEHIRFDRRRMKAMSYFALNCKRCHLQFAGNKKKAISMVLINVYYGQCFYHRKR